MKTVTSLSWADPHIVDFKNTFLSLPIEDAWTLALGTLVPLAPKMYSS